jgi:hypothetical protein
MYIKNKFYLPVVTLRDYLIVSVVLVLIAAVIYNSIGSAQVNLTQRELSSAGQPSLTRAQAAEAARWKALAEYYLGAQTPSLSRAQAAQAARLTGLAIFYGVEPASISPEVSALLEK